MIRTIIADDEAPARHELSFLLKEHSDLQLLGQAKNGSETVAMVRKHRPDLLFLDIQMPEMDGFAVARALANEPEIPYIVFVTAYSQRALEAFEVHAVDYLLKPVDPKRFTQCVERVRKNFQKDRLDPKNLEAILAAISKNGGADRTHTIAVRKSGRIYTLPVEEIHCLKVEQGVVEAVTKDGARTTNFATLEELENILDPELFFRAHRSYLVNRKSIREIVPLTNQTFRLKLAECENIEVPLSRQQAKKLRDIFRF